MAKWTQEEHNRFFDLIADGVSISEAARRIGRTKNSGIGRWHRVVESMGPQAKLTT